MSLLFSFQRPHFSVEPLSDVTYAWGNTSPVAQMYSTGVNPSVATYGFPWCEPIPLLDCQAGFCLFVLLKVNCALSLLSGLVYLSFGETWVWPRIVSEAPGPLSTPLWVQWRLSSCTSFQPWSQVVVVILPEGLPGCARMFLTSPAPYRKVTQPSPPFWRM